MDDYFDISGVFEISKFDIAGLACNYFVKCHGIKIREPHHDCYIQVCVIMRYVTGIKFSACLLAKC